MSSTARGLDRRLLTQPEEPFRPASFRGELETYRAVANGDAEKVRQSLLDIKKDYPGGKGMLSDDPVRNTRYHFIVSAAMTARMCTEEGLNPDIACALRDMYIRRADDCASGPALIDMLGEMFLDYALRMAEVRKSSVNSIHIRKCIDYIHAHLQDKLTIAQTAAYLRLTPAYLSRLFAKETGMSFRQFIIHARINAARSMIHDSELSFLDISLSLGFSSQSAFITTFRKITGQTPGEYRAACHHP